MISPLSEYFERQGNSIGHVNQWKTQLNWQATSPVIGFLPRPASDTGSTPSGVALGAMASTNTIYSNIIEKSRQQNIYAEINWTGTPTGTLSIWCSVSGINWNSLTFDPVLTQPSGSAAGDGINITQLAAKYFYFQYVNSSGSGNLTAFLQLQDLN